MEQVVTVNRNGKEDRRALGANQGWSLTEGGAFSRGREEAGRVAEAQGQSQPWGQGKKAAAG